MFAPAVILFGSVFCASLTANLVGIAFPIYWHPDEIGKALQIESGSYNFFHPLFLLRLAYVADWILAGDSLRDRILAGRIVSAIAAALAVAVFALLVACRFRSVALGATTGALLAATPLVFINAHFFKEDAVLLLGIACTMLAMQVYDEAPSRARLVGLGAALGLTFSAKYIGAVAALPVLYLLMRRKTGFVDIGFCLMFAVAVFVGINSLAIRGEGGLETGFLAELSHVTEGHGGIAWGALSPRTLIHFWENISAPILAALMIGLFFRSGRLAPLDAIVLLSPVIWLAAVQLSAVSFSRYVMPAVVLASVAAIWVYGMTSRSRRKQKALMLICLLTGGAMMIKSTANAALAFVDNPRERTAAWIRTNLPPDSVIATEFFTGLPTRERIALDPSVQPLPQAVVQDDYNLWAAGSLDRLRQRGVTHIVISSSNFARFYDRFATYSNEALERKKFYDEIFATLVPIHEEDNSSDADIILFSRILVYDIRR